MSHLELDFNRLKFLVGGTRPSQTQGSYLYIYIYIYIYCVTDANVEMEHRNILK